MLLALAREKRGDEADADGAAEIAHKRGESADLVVLLLRDAGVAEGVDGDDEEGESEGDEDSPADGHAEADVLVDGGHAPEAEGGDDESDGHEFARIESGREGSGYWEEEHEHQSTGRHGHAGLPRGVAHDLLQELRDEDGGGV